MKLAMRTMVLQFMLEGPRPCTILLVLTFALQLNILTGTFQFNWSVAPTHSNPYCGLCTVKAKMARVCQVS